MDKLKEMRSSGQSAGYQRGGGTSRPKMSEEERQKKLEEMQQNAQWRNEVRTQHVNRHRAEEKRTEEMEDSNNCRENQERASSLFKLFIFLVLKI